MDTRIVRRFCLVLLVLCLWAAPPSSARQAPPTFGEALRRHNIELTKPALIEALTNPDSDVRSLAAAKLAEDKAMDAIPAIKQALAAEKTPRGRVNIAGALGWLGDPDGRDELKKLCSDQNSPSEFRLYAVHYMFDAGVLNDEDCLQAAEDIVQLVDAENLTAGNRVTALELLSRFHNLTSDESQTVFGLMVRRLDDTEAGVRMEASRALATLGNLDAIPYLEAAIAREHDENIRAVLEANLKKLQKKQEK